MTRVWMSEVWARYCILSREEDRDGNGDFVVMVRYGMTGEISEKDKRNRIGKIGTEGRRHVEYSVSVRD
jgi:hypothetical protein